MSESPSVPEQGRGRDWAVGAVALAVIVLLAYGLDTQSPLESREAPDFALETFGGETLALRELRGQVVVLNFWASWCKPCRAEAPALESAWERYAGRGVAFVGVNANDLEKNALGFIEKYGLSYVNGPDDHSRIARAYRVRAVPETFFIDQEGSLAKRHIGEITEEQLQLSIEELLRP